ncbi:hypothetical protein A1O7_06127 [Cladophialophora yegresii CBS 114405]|uniref:Uncharacterized protein n=1 Tax=Cladophialophora yegresii CBS 114405 TaxID=1182544 RepID=W9VT02_9EURO|nr:uncharacterized protein A1O7_06127 [Cladophialophora yegresii CBS 114405]EXJ58698.1 hypothetical protein A1O7_06127 [Cladophialophora yegresii CBS 114405]
MGRRPNPLMTEFFERGVKISDMSNRYEQTCKRCGEHFARGRSEAMIPHLTKKCPAISYAERASIIFRLHDLVLPTLNPDGDPARNSESDGNVALAGNSGLHHGNGLLVGPRDNEQNQGNRTGGVAAQNGRQLASLELLAEVSSHVSGNVVVSAGYAPMDQAGGVLLDPQLEGDSFPVTTASTFATGYSYIGNVSPTPMSDLSLVSTGAPDLSTIAATAHATLLNESAPGADILSSSDISQDLLEESQEHVLSCQNSGRFPSTTVPLPPPLIEQISSMHPGHSLDEHFPPGPAMAALPSHIDRSSSQQLRPIAMNPNDQPNHLAEDNDLPAHHPKQRVRGKFAPERRDEVRQVRKLGACWRCRMLRKTCSQVTPCQTCASVENPRLWNISCVRTRLDEEFPLYFIMPYTVLTHHDFEKLKNQANQSGFSGRLEAFHFFDHKVTFKARQFTHVPIPTDCGDQPFPEDEVLVLDLETENVLPKIEQYLKAICPQIIEKEPSSAMKGSLRLAQAIEAEHQSRLLAENTQKSDNLVSQIVELWVATVVITDNQLTAFFSKDSALDSGQSAVDDTMHPFSHRMLTNQLRAAIEKRASVVCRSALHNFEQRLLRNKGKPFETFLVAFIMLNCAERMCWLYRSWATAGREFPLDQTPSCYAEKAESFAQTIQMLLSMRQLEPKIMQDPETGVSIARIRDDNDLTNWLAATGLSSDLAAHCRPGRFNPDDSRSLDGTFTGRLLQQ